MNTPKEQIIRLFLGFLSTHTPLSDARIATLGGKGIEAKIWAESGIPPEHGWLIELNRERGHRLIEDHRYRHHNRLGTFHQILRGQEGANAYIDGFHLDLCGTITDQVIRDFSPLLPLILQSTGKCFGVTVSDQRRNRSLEEWPKALERGEELFGKGMKDVLSKLEESQRQLPMRKDLPSFMAGFDPAKGARREFGLLVELLELFQKHPSWTPTQIARYVYVSRYAGRPFRMRSFFVRFAPTLSPVSGVAIANMWAESPLSFYQDSTTFVEIQAPLKQRTRQKPGEPMTSRLGDVARALGGAELAEYEELVRNATALQQIRTAVDSVTIITPAAPPLRLTSPRKSAVKEWADLTDAEKVKWQIKTLELRMQSNGSWDEVWKRTIETDFGGHTPELEKSLTSAIRRTAGKFRGPFEDRVRKVLGDEAPDYLERLAQVPSTQ